jgi:hypothetical protein
MVDTVGAFDARVAAILHGSKPGINDIIITSPNMDIIYQPPMGRRLVRLRSDCRYADDDFTLWPQPYIDEYCWLPVIPRRPECETDPLCIMWWNPLPLDFVPKGGGLAEEIGMLEASKASKLRLVCDDLFRRIADYQKSGGDNVAVLALQVALRHAMCRLESLSTSFKEMVFGVAETQRWYLELVAVLDWIMIFKRRMDGNLPRADTVAHVVGAFTENPRYVQAAFRAGIPVWFLRPLEALPLDVNILSVATPRSPADFLVMADWAESPSFPVIHNGPNSVEKVRQIHKYARTRFQYPDPFAGGDDSDPFLAGGNIPTVTETVPMAELERPRTVKTTKQARPRTNPIASGTYPTLICCCSSMLHICSRIEQVGLACCRSQVS